MIHGHGGNVFALARRLQCRPEDLTDMSSNINPLGTMPGLLEHLQRHLTRIQVLPEVDGADACAGLAAMLDLDPASLLAGAGSTQFIYSACRALASRRVLIVAPTYADYADACHQSGVEPHFFHTRAEELFRLDWAALERMLPEYDTLFLCTPNNPDGQLHSLDALAAMARRHPQVRCIVDTSYLPFAQPRLRGSLAALRADNLLLLWSGSKIFAIPGLRSGFLIAHPDLVARFRRLAQPWSLSSLAQEAMLYLSTHVEAVQRFVDKSFDFIQTERTLLHRRLQGSGLQLIPSATSFTLMRLPQHLEAKAVQEALLERRILIRDCSNFHGLDASFIRVALKDSDSNQRLASALLELADTDGGAHGP